MPIEHTNRKGDVYYLHAGRTPTRRPKYYCSRERGDAPLDTVPDGFEIWESPEGGLVYVRKAQPVVIPAFEREMVEDGIRRYAHLEYFLVDVQGDGLVIYLPSVDVDGLTRVMENFLPASASFVRKERNKMVRRSPFVKMMRFVLEDEDKRLFRVERWCFRGSIEDWWPLHDVGSLGKLVQKYAKHLGENSFFDLL